MFIFWLDILLLFVLFGHYEDFHSLLWKKTKNIANITSSYEMQEEG